MISALQLICCYFTNKIYIKTDKLPLLLSNIITREQLDYVYPQSNSKENENENEWQIVKSRNVYCISISYPVAGFTNHRDTDPKIFKPNPIIHQANCTIHFSEYPTWLLLLFNKVIKQLMAFSCPARNDRV